MNMKPHVCAHCPSGMGIEVNIPYRLAIFGATNHGFESGALAKGWYLIGTHEMT